MPYAKKSQARAVLANTDPDNPRHAEARREAKKRLQQGDAGRSLRFPAETPGRDELKSP